MNDAHIFQSNRFHYNILTERKVDNMEQILRSVTKRHLASASSSEDNNRSTVKRLFSSVFSIIDNDKEITDFDDQPQPSRIEKLLENSVFISHLQTKLRNEGLYDGYYLPIIRLSVKIISGYAHSGSQVQRAELDHLDIMSIFAKFGEINKIVLTNEKKDAYIFFNSFLNAYISFKMLRNMRLRGGSLEICIDWVENKEINKQISNEVHTFVSRLNWQSLFQNKTSIPNCYYSNEEVNSYSSKQNKFTCRYDIQIENQRQFQVARRIIGSKGCNMKRILEESIICNNENKNYSNDNANELLKLRLRGKGSGYKQGTQQQESNQNLHLCVSAKDQLVYNNACSKVQKLMATIYADYMEFSKKQGKMIELTVKRYIIGQNSSNQENYGSNNQIGYTAPQIQSYEYTDASISHNTGYRISPQKISQLLELRNKARRQLNFSEADRIRNYLRNCGVCLIDQKGRRGRATEVTTWKYLY